MTPQEHDLLTRTAVNLENLSEKLETHMKYSNKANESNRVLLEKYVTKTEFAPWKWAVMTIFAVIIGGAINAYFSGYNSLEGLEDAIDSVADTEQSRQLDITEHEQDLSKSLTLLKPPRTPRNPGS